MRLTVITVFLTLILQIYSENHKPKQMMQLTDATICKIQDHPYMVGIIRKSIFKFECAGSLLSSKFVLTAFHCVYQDMCTQDRYQVIAGANLISKHSEINIYAQFSDVVQCFSYSEQPDLSNDIAVVKLKTAIVENFHVKYVELGTMVTVSKSSLEHICYNGTVMGWGHEERNLERGKEDLNDDVVYKSLLHCDNLPALSWEKCKELDESITIKPHLFCAHKDTPGNCHGDSGGPFICNGTQFGLLSHGRGCHSKHPALFVKVYRYTDLIEGTMNRQMGKSSGSSVKTCFLFYFGLFVIIFK